LIESEDGEGALLSKIPEFLRNLKIRIVLLYSGLRKELNKVENFLDSYNQSLEK